MSVERLLRSVAVAVTVVVGAFAGLGFLLAALFELQGFGGPRDLGPRQGYLIELALGFVASILIPVLLWRWLLGGGPGWVRAGLVAATGFIVILGISLRL